MDEVLREMLKWAVLSAVISTTLFILQYTAYSPWWKDRVSRKVVFRDLTTVLSLVPLVGALFFHLTISESRAVAWVYTIAVALVSVIMVSCMITWYQERKKADPSWEEPTWRRLRLLAGRLRAHYHRE